MTDQDSNLPNGSEEETPKEPNGEPSNLPAISGEVLEKLPDDLKSLVSLQTAAFSAPVFNPLLKKITEGHITKVLDQSETESERDFKDKASSRRYGFAAFVIVCALFVFVTWYLTSVDKDLYRDIIKVLLGLVGGFGGGFALKGYLDRDEG
jgi:hypothetical protein